MIKFKSHPVIDAGNVPGLVSDIGAEVAADDAVPGGVVLLVELLLDVGGDVLLNVVLFQSLSCAVHGVLKYIITLLILTKLHTANLKLQLYSKNYFTCCISSDMSAFLMTALRSDMVKLHRISQHHPGSRHHHPSITAVLTDD